MSVFADKNYSERYAYQFFDEIVKNKIFEGCGPDGALTSLSKDSLRNLFDNYHNINKVNVIKEAHAEINIVKEDMKANIKKGLNNVEDLNVILFK